jgi:hypothetical protein
MWWGWQAGRQEGEPIGFLQSSGVSQLSGGHPAKLYPIGATPSPFESSTLVYTNPARDGQDSVAVVNKAPTGEYEFYPSSNLVDIPNGMHKLYTHPASADDSKHHAVLQAQIWAQEARTQKAIVKEIGEMVGCANDWEMVEAVRDALANVCVSQSAEYETQADLSLMDDKQAASVPEWIKCSDKMPKINSPVVVARISDNDGKPCLDSGVAALQPNNGWVGLGVFYRPKIDAGTIYQNDLSVMDVTHWMPLPDPPKQEQGQ